MYPMAYTAEQVTSGCMDLFQQAIKQIPAAISERLKTSRTARNHGSYRTVLIFNTWDRYQSDILPKNHFCYCLGYDPKQLISGGTDWYFHLWLNTIRIYRDRLAVKEELEKKLKIACPKSFKFDIIDRAISIKINFDLKGGPEDLATFLRPHYVRLIAAIHPILMPIIDKYSAYGTRQEIKTTVASRGRIAHKPVRTAHPELLRQYTRSIHPSWRREILDEFEHRCAHCNADLRVTGHHIDHRIPFSKGGTTVKTNLQPLCPSCNTIKGNRFAE